MESPKTLGAGRSDCPFCGRTDVVHANGLAFSYWDESPASPGHLLIIPMRHVPDFLALTLPEMNAMWDLAQRGRSLIERDYHPNGYILGANIGSAAGQTSSHAHLHLIPRYQGDVADPRGGVRTVIPSRQIDTV